MIGDDEPARVDDDARAERLRDARLLALLAEELAEDRIVEQRVARPRLDSRGVDVDHRRRDLLDHWREREPQLGWALRDDLVRRLGRRRGGGEAEGESEGEAEQGESPERTSAAMI